MQPEGQLVNRIRIQIIVVRPSGPVTVEYVPALMEIVSECDFDSREFTPSRICPPPLGIRQQTPAVDKAVGPNQR